MISCIFGFYVVQRLSHYRFLYSVIVGGALWLVQLFIVLSLHAPMSLSASYFFATAFFCIFGAHICLSTAFKENVTTSRYFLSGIGIVFSILGVGYLGFSIAFSSVLQWKPSLVTLAVLITAAIAFFMLRFLLQLRAERNNLATNHWLWIGGTCSGITLAGIPCIVMISLLENSIISMNGGITHFIFPFTIILGAALLLSFVPDLFAEARHSFHLNKLLENEVMYRSLFDHNPDAVFEVDEDGCFTNVNKGAEILTGFTEKELLEKHFTYLFSPEDKDEAKKRFQRNLSGHPDEHFTKVTVKEGMELDLRITAVPIVIRGKVKGLYAIAKNISGEKENARRIHYMAYHDALTGLGNRRSMFEQMEVLENEGALYCLVLIDFDRFKRANDLYGHPFGDKLLKETAERLQQLLRDREGAAYRFGGDEFAILLTEAEREGRSFDEELLASFQNPLSVDGRTYMLTPSAGVACYPRDGAEAELILHYADLALYYVKENGRNGIHHFQPAMKEEAIVQGRTKSR
ncbi:diguanylate cyclase domain-containing protein [Alteribacillus sp. HJP-4]|uniref:diguanylate cyclase domain-containing protein n=1 Tax=Alteribacillus sp. HJP-4 TaxID=2775394 RepID=UPI0035CCDF6C